MHRGGAQPSGGSIRAHPALGDQLCRWEQYHMHFLQATEGHVLQLLPVSSPGGSGGEGGLGFHGQDCQLGWERGSLG